MEDAMANITNEAIEDEIFDEALEAAAGGNAGAYAQFGLCTVSWCSGVERQAPKIRRADIEK
jgi:hypothetical protein